MYIQLAAPPYLQISLLPPPLEREVKASTDTTQPTKGFVFSIGENADTGGGFTQIFKAAQAGDVIAKQDVEKILDNDNGGYCSNC